MRGNVNWIGESSYPSVALLQYHSPETFMSVDELRSYMEHPKTFGLIMEERGDLRAYCLGAYVKKQQKTIVESLVTHSEYRRRGYGTALINEILYRTMLAEFNTIEIKVNESNLDSQLFLKDVGFDFVKSIPGKEEDRYLFVFDVKPLRETGNVEFPINLKEFAKEKKVD